MRIDLVLPNEGPYAQQAVQAAPEYEAMGFAGLWLTDHVIGVNAYAPVYGPVWLEILTTLAHVAARTSRVRLGTGVLVLPYRDPVLTAKMLASIDVLSGGRVDFGIGTGWARGEYHALGRAAFFEPRGAVTDAALSLILRCWEGGEFGWEDPYFSFRRIEFTPVPLQRPRIPLWIGARGLAPAPLRRAARFADIWHPTRLTPRELAEGGARLDDLAGRAVPRSLRLHVLQGTKESEISAVFAAYRAAGCATLVVDAKAETHAEHLRLAEAVLRAAASA